MENQGKGISTFQRYLSVWVLLCMAAGVLIGYFMPVIPRTLDKMGNRRHIHTNCNTHMGNDLSNDDKGRFPEHKTSWKKSEGTVHYLGN